MKKLLIILAIIFGVLLVIAFGIGGWVKNTYNSMVQLDEANNGAWAQVENVLQRRYDLKRKSSHGLLKPGQRSEAPEHLPPVWKPRESFRAPFPVS